MDFELSQLDLAFVFEDILPLIQVALSVQVWSLTIFIWSQKLRAKNKEKKT